MSDQTREPLPPDIVAMLLDPAERKQMKQLIAEVHALGRRNSLISKPVIANVHGTICNLYRLVDELRAEAAAWKGKYERLIPFAEANLGIVTETLQAEKEMELTMAHDEQLAEINYELINESIAAEHKIKRLTAENDSVWDAIANLHDLLTEEQIDAELKRLGIDVTAAHEKVRAALAKRRDGG